MEIVSPFNEPIYLFSGAIPKEENVINVTFPFFWFGFALIVHTHFHTQSGSMFLEEAPLNELKRWDRCVMIEERMFLILSMCVSRTIFVPFS